jgi:hypothetical protein
MFDISKALTSPMATRKIEVAMDRKFEVEISNIHNLFFSRPGTTQIMSFGLAKARPQCTRQGEG